MIIPDYSDGLCASTARGHARCSPERGYAMVSCLSVFEKWLREN